VAQWSCRNQSRYWKTHTCTGTWIFSYYYHSSIDVLIETSQIAVCQQLHNKSVAAITLTMVIQKFVQFPARNSSLVKNNMCQLSIVSMLFFLEELPPYDNAENNQFKQNNYDQQYFIGTHSVKHQTKIGYQNEF
jgi:hypothetical protein